MIQRSTVLELVKQQGPLLPKDISQSMRENMLFIAAMLSELVSAKKIKYSHLKVGASPLYYYEGQEEKLQEYSDKLPKELHDVYKYLNEKKVVKDTMLRPRIRAWIRQLKDFAHPFTRTTPDGKELFWKWYLVSPDDATRIVKERYPPKNQGEEKKGGIIEKDKKIEAPVMKAPPEVQKPAQKTLIEDVKASPREKTQTLEEMKKTLEEERKKLEEERKNFLEEKKALEKKREQLGSAKKITIEDDPLFKQVKTFLELQGMELLQPKVLKKGADIEGQVRVKSTVGDVLFLCRAKSKKRYTRKDLEELHEYALERKRPLLIPLQTELPKKTTKLIEEEFPLIQTILMPDGSKDN